MSKQGVEIRFGHQHILYDADAGVTPDPGWFEPEYLQQLGLLTGEAAGRGRVWFVARAGPVWVLRHYRRGGRLAPLNDRYLWTGLQWTRAWREWRLLAWMSAQGLPVSAPIAARVVRSQAIYRADLITKSIPGAQSLAKRLVVGPLPGKGWQCIGQVIHRFHAAGIEHADLNAHNILIDHHDDIFLIDFDKARIRRHRRGWPRSNLERLRRSLRKLLAGQTSFKFCEEDFKHLRAGYDAA